MLFCDKSRYQAADRSGMFVGNPTCNTLVYEDFDEYQHRYTLRQVQVGLDDRHRDPWHEQFDSISKDFIASLDEEIVSKFLSKLINRFQKWWSLFGKYWLVKNAYNNDDTKLMKWLMTGANHGTIDKCGENVSNARELPDRKMGCLAQQQGLNNHSKQINLELGQQLPIKSPFKMKRDIVKWAINGSPSATFNVVKDENDFSMNA